MSDIGHNFNVLKGQKQRVPRREMVIASTVACVSILLFLPFVSSSTGPLLAFMSFGTGHLSSVTPTLPAQSVQWLHHSTGQSKPTLSQLKLTTPSSTVRTTPLSVTDPFARPEVDQQFTPATGKANDALSAEGIADTLDDPVGETNGMGVGHYSTLLAASMVLLLGTFQRLISLKGESKNGYWCLASLAASDGTDIQPADIEPEATSKSLWQRIVGFTSLLRPDFLLLSYLAVWYFGNYKSNISNKLALAEMGGALGCPLLIGSAEMLVGVIYAVFLWCAPDARPLPQITLADVKALIPLTICTLGHQFSTVYATSAGSLSSVQILKATEPVFAAVFASFIYGASVSRGKWLSLIPIIGGVSLASLKEISFSWIACVSVLISNVFSAVRSNESRKAMQAPGLKDRLGSVGNQFAVTTCLCFLMGLPLSLLKEWHKIPTFVNALYANPVILAHIVSAGFWFYIYNEVSTLVVKRTGALTQSVLNTAKRVIVIVGASIVLGEGLAPMKLIGCMIGITGVFIYSVADKLKRPPKAAAVSTQ